MFKKCVGFCTFHAAADRVQDAAAQSLIGAVEAEPVGHVEFEWQARAFEFGRAPQAEKALLEEHTQNFFAQQGLGPRIVERVLKVISCLEIFALAPVWNGGELEKGQGGIYGIGRKNALVLRAPPFLARAMEMVRDVNILEG